jgi:sulfite exporter TauE/SafE
MDGVFAVISGGFLLGLASSVHCACMCGGIASGALFLLRPETSSQRLTALCLMHSGRIATYALAGGTIAGTSSFTINPGSTDVTFRLLQWMGAIVLMWAGLSTAGLLPRFAGFGVRVPSMSVLLEPILRPARRHPRLSPLAALWSMRHFSRPCFRVVLQRARYGWRPSALELCLVWLALHSVCRRCRGPDVEQFQKLQLAR